MREVSKVSGVSFFVTLNLFQGLAIVTNRMPPHPNPPPRGWGGNRKYVTLNLFQGLAIVTNRMPPPTLTLPSRVGRELKVCHPELCKANQNFCHPELVSGS